MIAKEGFDVSSRGDTQEFSDLNKLAKHFLKGSQDALEGETKDLPSPAYVKEVVEELRKGEQAECPICLEAFEDAVLTPCAHRLCRECLLASWRNLTSGFCPVCRYLLVNVYGFYVLATNTFYFYINYYVCVCVQVHVFLCMSSL